MKNQLDKLAYKLLLNSENWKLVCSPLPPEARQVKDHTHKKWLKKNSDTHPHREIVMALKGSTTCSLNGKCYETAPGTVLLFDHFERHDRGYPPNLDEIEHLWLYPVGRKIIVGIIRQMKYCGQAYIIEEHLFLTLQHTWNKLEKPELSDEMKRKQIISVLSLIFLEILEQDIQGGMLTPASNYQARIITMIEEHIKETSGNGSSLDRLARIAGYSKFHFLRLFKQHTGQRVHTYINEVRIRKVEDMLQKGFMKKEIAEKLGFSCPAAFANWYRKNHVSSKSNAKHNASRRLERSGN